jgi:hypothetical protein
MGFANGERSWITTLAIGVPEQEKSQTLARIVDDDEVERLFAGDRGNPVLKGQWAGKVSISR